VPSSSGFTIVARPKDVETLCYRRETVGLLKEFKEFAGKGNALDIAVGIIIGAAFNKIVTSQVNDIIMPPIGILLGGDDFKNLKLVLRPPACPPPAHPRSRWPSATACFSAQWLTFSSWRSQSS
jgi:hypothetical protein